MNITTKWVKSNKTVSRTIWRFINMYYTVMKPCKAGKDNLEMLQYQKRRQYLDLLQSPTLRLGLAACLADHNKL